MKAFGYTREEMQLVLGPMYREGVEPLGSMGDDTPLSVLSSRPRLLFSYFKQHFAQVTNPPIDPLREALVMSLATHLGPRANLLDEIPEAAAQIHLPSPLLSEAQVVDLLEKAGGPEITRTLPLLFSTREGTRGFRKAREALLDEAQRAALEGVRILVLSDRGIDAWYFTAIDFRTGQVIERTYRADEKVPLAMIDKREMQYLYREGTAYVFMDNETYEQLHVEAADLGDAVQYLKEGDTAILPVYNDAVVGVELPAAVELLIAQTEPGVQGDRVSGARKPATLETGLVVQVPLFIEAGERIKVDTRTGEYLARA
jgi:elongation factor P